MALGPIVISAFLGLGDRPSPLAITAARLVALLSVTVLDSRAFQFQPLSAEQE